MSGMTCHAYFGISEPPLSSTKKKNVLAFLSGNAIPGNWICKIAPAFIILLEYRHSKIFFIECKSELRVGCDLTNELCTSSRLIGW